VLRDGFEAREDAALLPGCVGRRGDHGGEAGELEVDSRRGDFSPKFRRRADGLARERSRLRFQRKQEKRERWLVGGGGL
jgi:hypothetical protein